jgi:hypothetical protein
LALSSKTTIASKHRHARLNVASGAAPVKGERKTP